MLDPGKYRGDPTQYVIGAVIGTRAIRGECTYPERFGCGREFAVKLPGRDDAREFVYLPIDAKFPKDVYEQLLDAYDAADSQAIETAGKLLETTIKKMAKDISDKYLAPPATTDFGIMFLRSEGIRRGRIAVPL